MLVTGRSRRKRRRTRRRMRIKRRNTSHSCSVGYYLCFVSLLGVVLILRPPKRVLG